MELLILNAYLGSIVFLICTIILIVTLYKRKLTKGIMQIIFLSVMQFLVSNLISLVIWRFWILEIDIMFLFISIPALIAECITIPITLYILKKWQGRSKRSGRGLSWLRRTNVRCQTGTLVWNRWDLHGFQSADGREYVLRTGHINFETPNLKLTYPRYKIDNLYFDTQSSRYRLYSKGIGFPQWVRRLEVYEGSTWYCHAKKRSGAGIVCVS